MREMMNYDVVIVGAGPAGLTAAIRLKQLSQKYNITLSVCVLEKAAEVGAHTLSGAVFEPRALSELLPNWQELGAPLQTLAHKDEFLFLTAKRAVHLPVPRAMRNKGNYIISLSELCRWLGTQAAQLGVEIYPGFAATEILYDEENTVCGVVSGAMGIDKAGEKTPRYQPGVELRARQTLFAEGCRGFLSEQVISKYDLRANSAPQTYGIGVKELWQVDNALHKPGLVMHSVGWPLDHQTYGGSFIYHLDQQRLTVGFVIGLDYQNPSLDPFAELQRFKTHPRIRDYFANGQRLEYGARALNEGGLQSIPKVSFPGGLLIGDGAGFLNVAKIKGSHTAMQSGLIAAETVYAALQQNNNGEKEVKAYTAHIKNSWVSKELYQVRNIRPAFRWGLLRGLAYAAVDTYLLRGYAPWTFSHQADHLSLKAKADVQTINYPKADGKLTFDKLSSVYLTNTYHAENQPCHLQLHNPQSAMQTNFAIYGSPEQYYCPAGVYEIIYQQDKPVRLQINAQNCIHCKSCDIKDPTQNIRWVPPEGGGGPNYRQM